MAGTGLPIPKTGLIGGPSPVVSADQFSVARSWGEVAQSGARIAAAGEAEAAAAARTAASYSRLAGAYEQVGTAGVRAAGAQVSALQTVGAVIDNQTQKFVHQQQVGYLADQEVEMRRARIEMHDKFMNTPTGPDPEGFDNTWQAYQNGKLENAQPWAVPHLRRALSSEGNTGYSSILSTRRGDDQRLSHQAINGAIKIADDDVMSHAGAGTLNTPDGQTALLTYQNKVAAGVTGRLIAPDMAEFMVENLKGRGAAETAAVKGVEVYREKGKAAAIDFLNKEIKENTELTISPANRNKAFAHGLAAIKREEQIDKQDRVGIVEDSRDIRKRLEARIPVDATEIRQMKIALTRVGAASELHQLIVREGVSAGIAPMTEGAKPREGAAITAGFRTQAMVQQPRAQQAMQFFTTRGYTPAQAAGIVGNLLQESATLDTTQVHDQGTGLGIAGWRQERRTALQRFAAAQGTSPTDFNTQLAFIDHELNTTEGKAGAALRAAKNPAEAAAAFLHFERPAGYTEANPLAGHGAANRIQNAQMLAEGGGAVGGSPYAGEIAKGVQQHFVKEMREAWPGFKKRIESGQPMESADIAAINYAAALSGSSTWAAEVQSLGIASSAIIEIQKIPTLAGKQAAMDQLTADLKASGLEPINQDTILKAATKAFEQLNTQVREDQIGYYIDTTKQAPPPLNLNDPAVFQGGLLQRASIVRSVSDENQVPAGSVLRPTEVAAVQAHLERSDLPTKTRIYGALAALPDDIRAATFSALGNKGPDAMVEAFAGALSSLDPDVGTSILRGRMAQKGEPRYDPTQGSNKDTFNDIVDKALPATTFALPIRTNESNALSTMRSAVIARYADLSAQAGDTSGTVSEPRLQKAVQDVTGGVLRHNGGTLIAPARGMPQSNFDGVLQGLTNADLPDVTTLAGEPVTAQDIRNRARLESFGDGRYLVQLGANPAQPIYAVQGARDMHAGPRPFVLDLRGRPVAPLVLEPGREFGGTRGRGFDVP